MSQYLIMKNIPESPCFSYNWKKDQLDLQSKLSKDVTSHTILNIIEPVFSSYQWPGNLLLFNSSIISLSADATQKDVFGISALKHFNLTHYYKMTELWVVIRDHYWKKFTDCFYCHPIVHTNSLYSSIHIYKTQMLQNSLTLNNFNTAEKPLQNQQMTSM